MASLQDKIKKSTAASRTGTELGTTPQSPEKEEKPISQSEASKYLSELETLAKDPAYSRPGSPPQDALAAAMQDAKDLYKQQSSRNDWAQVAERLGRAVAQFAGAQAGMASSNPRGSNMSGLDFGAPVDWEGRQSRAFKEYQGEVGNATDQYSRERQNASDLGSQRKEDYGRQESYLQTALRDAQAKERAERDAEAARLAEEARSGRDDKKLAAQNKREDRKDAKKEKSDFDRQASEDRKLELKNLADREKELIKEAQAQQTLFNQMGQEDDLSGKSQKKLQEKYGDLAGKAGVDLTELQAELATKTKDGMLWGKNPDEEAQQAHLKEMVQKKLTLLKAIRNRQSELLGGKIPGAEIASKEAPEQQKEEQSPTVKMRAPDGSIGEVPRENVKAAQDSGLELVE